MLYLYFIPRNLLTIYILLISDIKTNTLVGTFLLSNALRVFFLNECFGVCAFVWVFYMAHIVEAHECLHCLQDTRCFQESFIFPRNCHLLLRLTDSASKNNEWWRSWFCSVGHFLSIITNLLKNIINVTVEDVVGFILQELHNKNY